MRRRPPRSTRTDTLFPYTTLFRSRAVPRPCGYVQRHRRGSGDYIGPAPSSRKEAVGKADEFPRDILALFDSIDHLADYGIVLELRSEERRVGQECVSTCTSRWSPYH